MGFCAKYITVQSTCETRVWSEIIPSRWYWRTYNNIVAMLDVARDCKDPASVTPSAAMLVPTMKAPERVTTRGSDDHHCLRMQSIPSVP